jgi:hypothetical protein
MGRNSWWSLIKIKGMTKSLRQKKILFVGNASMKKNIFFHSHHPYSGDRKRRVDRPAEKYHEWERRSFKDPRLEGKPRYPHPEPPPPGDSPSTFSHH